MSADSPVAILYDSAGDPIHSYDFDGQKHLATAILQDAHASAGNSSTANLNAGGTFTGTAQATSGVAGVRILLASDQILQVYLQQSSDSTNWDMEDSWLVYPGQGSGGVVQVVSAYIRVKVTNISPGTTTYLRLYTLLCPTIEALPRALTGSGTVRMAEQTKGSFPDLTNFTAPERWPALKVDWLGNLSTRGPVLTDERSFRDDFTDGAITVSVSGVLTFSDGVYVTGNATSFLTQVRIGDYLKLDSDGQSGLTLVNDVLSDTLLVLDEPYQGTPGTGVASRAYWYYQSGNGGSLSYSTSMLELVSGVTPGGHSTVLREGDFSPFSSSFLAKVDNRYANQDSYMGFMETAAYLAEKMAAVRFSGTDATKVELITSFSSDDQEITEVTLPGGGTTADYHQYRIYVSPSLVSLWVDDIKLAAHTHHIPGPYDKVEITVGIANLGAVIGTSTLSVDVVNFSNFNQVDMMLRPQDDALTVTPHKSLSTSSSSVAAAVADTALLPVSFTRTGATIHNDSTSILYLKLGTGASATSFTVRMGTQAYYELPYGYSGAVHGYWVSADGAARVTEVY